jgi:hypothetical protein
VFLGEPGSASVDLSKATKLKDVLFQLNSWSVRWVITALQTISPKHRDLQQITIWLSHYLTGTLGVGTNIRRAIGEVNFRQLLDLDRLLVQLWESYSIRPKAVVSTIEAVCVEYLLPEMTKRGIVDFAEFQYGSQWV